MSSLIQLIRPYIDFPVEQTKALLKVFETQAQDRSYNPETNKVTIGLEKDEKNPKLWKKIKTIAIDAPEATVADFLMWMNTVGQNWFQGHNRASYEKMSIDDFESVWQTAYKTGLLNERTYDMGLHGRPTVAVVSGSSESVVKQHLKYLKKMMRKGTYPVLKTIVVSAGPRKLGAGVSSSEEESIEELKRNGIALQEKHMAFWQTKKMLDQLKQEDPFFKDWQVDLAGADGVADRNDPKTVKTAEASVALRQHLDKLNLNSRDGKPITVMIVFKFVERQVRDTKDNLGEAYDVIGVGTAISAQELKDNYSIFLGEVARLFFQAFSKEKHLEQQFQRPLTDEERRDWLSLATKDFKKTEINQKQPQVIRLFSTHFFNGELKKEHDHRRAKLK